MSDINNPNLYEIDQIILMIGLQKILAYHEQLDKDINPYPNLISIDSDNPELAFNRILSVDPEIYQFYNELTVLQKSFLVPKIQIFRKDNNNKDVPIFFGSHFDSNEYREFVLNPQRIQTLIDENGNPTSKTGGVGLKRITISDRSERPTDVNISCKIELFFEDILSLTNSNFLKLITSPELRRSDSSIDFRIKLIIGWETPNDASQMIFTPEMIEIVEKSNIVYLLQLTTHTIDIQENGSVNVNIEYQGALEKYFGTHSDMDILDVTNLEKLKLFAPTATGNSHISEYMNAIIEKKKLDEQLDVLNKSANKIKDQKEFQTNPKTEYDSKIKEFEDKLEKVNNTIAKLELFIIKDKYARILKSVTESNRMFYLTIPYSIVEVLANKSKQRPEDYDAIVGITAAISTPQKIEFTADEKKKTSAQEQIDEVKKEVDEIFGVINKEINEGDGGGWGNGSLRESMKKRKGLPSTTRFGRPVVPEVPEVEDTEEIEGEDEEIRKVTEEELQEIDTDDLEDIYEDKLFRAYNQLLSAKETVPNMAKVAAVVVGAVANISSEKRSEEGGKNRFIHYVTVGDIINSAVGFLIIPQDIDLLFGPCKIGNLSLNILNIPIAVSNFSVWFINKVVKQVKRKYFLWDFINDLFRDLVMPNLTGIQLAGKITSNLTVATCTVYSDKKLDRGGKYLDSYHIRSSLSRNVKTTDKIYQYLVVYIYDFQLENRDGIMLEDLIDGIFHFGTGRSRGIVKKINFSKIDFARLQDLRLTGNKLNTPGELLREHYNIKMDTYGSPLFMNGANIYYDGSFMGLLGREITEQLGLGGYYLVSGIETTISQDTYEQSINCSWTSMRKNSAENKINIKTETKESVKKAGQKND